MAGLFHNFDGPFYDFDGELVSYEEWLPLFAARERQVAFTEVGEWRVSTVWLGLDFGLGFSDVPLIYETMVFDPEPVVCERTPNRDAALAAHDQAVALARDHAGAA